MHLLFLDESGQLSQQRFFALGGIALRDVNWQPLRDLWQDTLAAQGWPADREIKWHGIRTGEIPPTPADAIVEALAHASFTCYVTLLDIELGLDAAPDFFASDEETYATGLMFLAERFQHLLAAEDDVGLIIVDSRFREDDTRLRRFFSDLTKDGTPYSRLDRIVEGLFLGPSHHSIGLQCADLVCSITAAAERGNGQARGYLKQILPSFAVHRAVEYRVHRWPDQPMGEHGLHSWWYRCLERAGIVEPGTTSGERMHKARHTAGQRVLDATGNLKATQKLLGHASISTTGDIYADWDIDQLAETMRIVLEGEK